jgi:CRISPR-associated protein Cas2
MFNLLLQFAIKVNGNKTEELEILVNTGKSISQDIISLTGITNEMLVENGLPIAEALEKLVMFIDNLPIIGYFIEFDISFINTELLKLQRKQIRNKSFDLMRFVKKENMFLENYRLETVLKEYGIHRETRHRALIDAQVTYELSKKVNGFLDFVKQTV